MLIWEIKLRMAKVLSHHNLEYLRVFPRFQYYILTSADHQINKIVFVFNVGNPAPRAVGHMHPKTVVILLLLHNMWALIGWIMATYAYYIFKYVESFLFYFIPLGIQLIFYLLISKHLFSGSERLHRRVTVRSILPIIIVKTWYAKCSWKVVGDIVSHTNRTFLCKCHRVRSSTEIRRSLRITQGTAPKSSANSVAGLAFTEV
jgi:hypothetical protein